MVGRGGSVYASFKINQRQMCMTDTILHMPAPRNPSRQAPKYPFTSQACRLCSHPTVERPHNHSRFTTVAGTYPWATVLLKSGC